MQSELSDKELASLFKRDSERAIEILFRRHYTYLCQAVYRILLDEHLAEDLVQDVFFELWKKYHRLTINISYRAYLRRAVINKSLNYIRDHRRVHFEQQDDLPLTTSLADAEQLLEKAELQELIDRAIDQLPDRCRVVFVLSRFEDLTYREIAESLDISEKTVENQISKALRWLRSALGPYLLRGGLVLAVVFMNF